MPGRRKKSSSAPGAKVRYPPRPLFGFAHQSLSQWNYAPESPDEPPFQYSKPIEVPWRSRQRLPSNALIETARIEFAHHRQACTPGASDKNLALRVKVESQLNCASVGLERCISDNHESTAARVLRTTMVHCGVVRHCAGVHLSSCRAPNTKRASISARQLRHRAPNVLRLWATL